MSTSSNVDELVAVLRGEDIPAARRAATVLRDMEEAGLAAIGALLEVSDRNETPSTPRQMLVCDAWEALEGLGEHVPNAFPQIQLPLDDAYGPSGGRPDFPRIIPLLMYASRHEQGPVRRLALRALAHVMESDSGRYYTRPVMVALRVAATDPEAAVRAASLPVLRYCVSEEEDDETSTEALEHLINALKDPEAQVRLGATHTLGECAAAAAPAVSALTVALRDPHDLVRRTARFALGQVGPKAAPALPDMLAATAGERSMLAYALGGLSIPEVVPILIELLKDPDPGTRADAAAALRRQGCLAAPAVNELAQLLSNSDPERLEAAKALAEIGPAVAAVIPALILALSDGTNDVRWMSAKALGKAGAAAAPAVARLSEMAQKDDMRSMAVEALGQIGAAAAPAVPVLKTIAADESLPEWVRSEAKEAVRAIQAEGENLRHRM